jgi:predicted Zn-dependent protease
MDDDLAVRWYRVLLLPLALAACAWFVLGARQAQETNRASALLSAPRTLNATKRDRASALLAAAGTLNPDSQVDLLRGELALSEHARRRAAAIVEGVVRREPMNIRAWLLLAEVNPSLRVLEESIAMIARLDPLLSRHR